MDNILKNDKLMLIIFLAFVFLNLLLLNNLGQRDNNNFLAEQMKISQALSSYNEKDFSSSYKLLAEAQEGRYKGSYTVNLQLARSLKELTRDDEAWVYYKTAFNINPGLLKEESFREEIKGIGESNLGY